MSANMIIMGMTKELSSNVVWKTVNNSIVSQGPLIHIIIWGNVSNNIHKLTFSLREL